MFPLTECDNNDGTDINFLSTVIGQRREWHAQKGYSIEFDFGAFFLQLEFMKADNTALYKTSTGAQ